MMATSMNQKVEDHTALMISQLYAQIVPEQGGESKRRRRRKKNKGGGDGGAKKRKLSSEQARLLEMSFGNEHKLESERKDRLASELGLEPRQVAVWFQNRRARWRAKKLEEEYSKLKTLHENVVLEKCRLESEVMKLKEQVIEAEKEIQRLSDNSPSSSLSMDPMEPPFIGYFGVEDFGDIFYMPEYNYIHAMEWITPYL